MRIDVKEILRLNNVENQLLEQYREQYQFSPAEYVEAKTLRLAEYCDTYRIDSLTVLVSGGVDSAVVAALCGYYARRYGKKLHLVTIPETGNRGVTRQEETIRLAEALAGVLGAGLTTLPLDTIVAEGARLCGLESAWGVGQTVSYFRTALAYSYVTSLWASGERSLLAGTTNLDEGAYIGYVGKASDGMVDLQLISDLHKSEVYRVAEYLDVPEDITRSIPQGDMYHGAVDEQIFGCTYDAVELFYAVKANMVPAPDTELWEKIVRNIEDLHTYNKHKYLGCSPAVHLDVKPQVRKLDGGWSYKVWEPAHELGA